MNIVGIDSASHVGLVILNGDEAVGKPITTEGLRGMARLQSIARQTRLFLEVWKPELAVMEGFAYGNHNSLVLLVQCATVIHLELHRLGVPLVVVPPTTLKKWTTGTGSANKELMAQKVFERWGYRSPSTDLVDAYALARMGQLGPGLTAMKGVQHER